MLKLLNWFHPIPQVELLYVLMVAGMLNRNTQIVLLLIYINHIMALVVANV